MGRVLWLSRAAKLAGLAVLCAALVLAYAPHLLLRVPKFGFILFNLAGGEVPGYFDRAIFRREKDWQRSGDVIVSTCTKCGTTWLLQTAHHMRFRGKTPEFRDLHEEVRWIEFVYYPGQPMKERTDILRRQHVFERSVFKTHFQPPIVNIRDDAKYLVGVRSIVDVAASLRQFFPNHDPYFARMWGGFPVSAGRDSTLSDEEDQAVYEHMFLKDVGNGHAMLDVLILDHIRGWWPHRKKKNVMFVHYANRISDHIGVLSNVSNFLEIDMTPEELNNVINKTSFQAMKAESTKYDFGDCFNEFKARGLVPKEMNTLVKDLVQVGPNRCGSKELPAAFVAAIKAHVEARFGPVIAKYLNEGGDIPLDEELPESAVIS